MSGFDQRKASPAATKAAAVGGMDGWGQLASAETHVRYKDPIPSRSRQRCYCGCGRRATHLGKANGIALMHGCELSVTRWVKLGFGTPEEG